MNHVSQRRGLTRGAIRRFEAAGTALVLTFALYGCSSLPERIDTLEEARTAVQSLRNEPLAREVAETQFDNAQRMLRAAEESYEERESLDVIEHNAYMALRNAQVAQQMIAEERAREELQRGEAERSQVLLRAREAEAELAQAQAEQAEARAENAQARAEQAQTLAEQRQAEIDLQAQAAEEARLAAAAMAQELADLKAEQTERGLVLTLDDVLFDTGRAVLQPGAQSTIARLAQFMNDYPERRILVEGHTDSMGTDEFNLELSDNRADAVRDALLDEGVDSRRIDTEGLGEAYPVASNDSAAGRQLNRRVEIVISDQNGEFPAAAQRNAAVR